MNLNQRKEVFLIPLIKQMSRIDMNTNINLIFKNKENMGKILFLISFLILIWMFVTPISTILINVDEHFTLSLMQQAGSDFWNVIFGDVHPPLYYLILKVAYILFSHFENINLIYILKVVSFIPYFLILILSFTHIRKKYSWFTAGLFTFCIGTMSLFFIRFLIIRMYGWSVLFVLLTFISFMNVIENFDNKSWALLTIFTILSAYTHNIVLVTLGLIYLALLIFILKSNNYVNNQKELKKWLFSSVVSVLLYIPWLFITLQQMSSRHSIAKFHGIKDIINYLTYHAIYFKSITPDVMFFKLLSIILLVLVILIPLFKLKREFNVKNYEISSGIIIYVLSIILNVLIVTFTFKSFDVKLALPSLSIFWLSTSILVNSLKNKKTFTILFVIILILGSYGIINNINNTQTYYEAGLNEMETLKDIDENGVFIYTSRLDYYTYHQYFNNTKEYSLTELNVPYKTNVINEKNVTKIIEENPDKKVYMKIRYKKEKNKLGKEIKFKQKINKGGSTIYELKLKNKENVNKKQNTTK